MAQTLTGKIRPRFFERTSLVLLLLGALIALYYYQTTPMRVFTSRDLASGPDGMDSSELFSSEFAQTRLFTELPPVEPMANELRALRAKLEPHHHFKLVLEYVIENRQPPAEIPPQFEYYSTLPVLPLVGETYQAIPGKKAPCIQFTWTPMPVKDVKYIVEIGKSRSFKYYRSFGVHTNRIMLRAMNNADYFWRVRATHKGKGNVSPPSRFTVVVPPDPDVKRRQLASRMKMPEAWLADVQVCP